MNRTSLTLLFLASFGLSSVAHAVGNPTLGKEKSQTCAACHGADGNSAMDAFPNLAGQSAAYIVKQLQDYQSGARQNAIMAPMAAALSAEDMQDLAAYYAQQAPQIGSVDESLLDLGQKIYRGGIAASGVPACMACHGPAAKGMPASAWPALSGQWPAYTQAQMHAFASGERHNDPAEMMRDIAKRLTAEEIEAVSAYVRGLH